MPSTPASDTLPSVFDAANPFPNLTLRQVQAAHLLAAGHRPSDVAQSLSIARATLYRWQDLTDFAAYLNTFLSQRAQEVTAAGSFLASESLSLVRQTLTDAKAPLELRLRLACRMLALYSRPDFLKHLQTLSDDPEVLAHTQFAHFAAASNLPKDFDGGDIELYQSLRQNRLAEAEVFESRVTIPHPSLPPAPPSADTPRDTVRHDETHSSVSPAPPATSPASSGTPRDTMRQNETPPAVSSAPAATSPASSGTPRDTVRHNETPPAVSPAPAVTSPASSGTSRDTVRHNETPPAVSPAPAVTSPASTDTPRDTARHNETSRCAGIPPAASPDKPGHHQANTRFILTTADGVPVRMPPISDADVREFEQSLNPLIPPDPAYPIPAACLAAVDEALAGLRTGIAHAAAIPSPGA